mmetsp:Transcript_29935/g.78391  ORF Transcript_29935/g.78391 Transcript_29935/m.78391 type:complete len:261 (-) Transcript_29935:169-951(-)
METPGGGGTKPTNFSTAWPLRCIVSSKPRTFVKTHSTREVILSISRLDTHSGREDVSLATRLPREASGDLLTLFMAAAVCFKRASLSASPTGRSIMNAPILLPMGVSSRLVRRFTGREQQTVSPGGTPSGPHLSTIQRLKPPTKAANMISFMVKFPRSLPAALTTLRSYSSRPVARDFSRPRAPFRRELVALPPQSTRTILKTTGTTPQISHNRYATEDPKAARSFRKEKASARALLLLRTSSLRPWMSMANEWPSPKQW